VFGKESSSRAGCFAVVVSASSVQHSCYMPLHHLKSLACFGCSIDCMACDTPGFAYQRLAVSILPVHHGYTSAKDTQSVHGPNTLFLRSKKDPDSQSLGPNALVFTSMQTAQGVQMPSQNRPVKPCRKRVGRKHIHRLRTVSTWPQHSFSPMQPACRCPNTWVIV
jgi:hypothetical protein